MPCRWQILAAFALSLSALLPSLSLPSLAQEPASPPSQQNATDPAPTAESQTKQVEPTGKIQVAQPQGDKAKPKTKPKPKANAKPAAEIKAQPGSNPRAKIKTKTDTKTNPAAPDQAPQKIVVREGSAAEPATQIVTDMSAQEATSRRQDTEKLLSAADENLKRLIGRPLDPQQQETVSQIHNYVEHARSALSEGDISRGHTLALKANLLADDLVKH